MAYEVKIYGEVVPFQDNWILEQGGFVNLSSVQAQLKEANGEDVKVRLNCFGGDVDEGFAIYSELRRYAKDNEAKVETLAEGRCASIATVIFLAGDSRVLTEYTEPFVHNAWCYAIGDANTITRVAADLEKCNERIANHYANHTNLTYEEARELMDAETSITPDEAVNMRFATSIEEVLRPVALKRFSHKNIKNDNKMSDKKEKGWFAKQVKALMLQISNKKVLTADQKEVDFYELLDDEPIEVNANATYEGQPAEGELVMANGETYVFAAGVLTEIKPKEEEIDNSQVDDVEALQAKLEEANKTIEALNNQLSASNSKLEASQANNKLLKETIGKISALEQEFEEEKPGTPPKHAPKAESTVDEAIKNLRTIKLKK